MNVSFLKLEIFIPETHLGALKAVLREVDAGHIGNYDCCLSYSQVMSTWRPLAGMDPYIGKENVISIEPELKVEVTIRTEKLRQHRTIRLRHLLENLRSDFVTFS